MKQKENQFNSSKIFGNFLKGAFIVFIAFPLFLAISIMSIGSYLVWIFSILILWDISSLEYLTGGLIFSAILIAYLLIEPIIWRNSRKNFTTSKDLLILPTYSRLDNALDKMGNYVFLPFYFIWKDVVGLKIGSHTLLSRNLNIYNFHTGERASIIQLLLRNLSEIILVILTLGFSSFLTWYLMMFSKNKRRIGDYVAGTIILVDQESYESPERFDLLSSIIIFSIDLFIVSFGFLTGIMVLGIVLILFVVAIYFLYDQMFNFTLILTKEFIKYS